MKLELNCNLKTMLSITFAMIKPEAVAIPCITKVIWDEILVNKLEIVGAKRIHLNREMARKLYAVHEGKFFYERLIQHVISGPVIVMKLGCATGNAIERWRALMGPSKMLRTLQLQNVSSLRARFALSDTRNLVHGADSQQTANYELSLFAPYPKINLQCILPK
uniref:Nucleoside diphosphate kinase-like domain-containing protein n=1 Tax=Wuchereria bancrofti TaxID=6293 RepID=A0AAF5RSX4_WUCBA